MKYLQIVAEESTSGIWDQMGNVYIDIDTLDLPEEYIEKFNIWFNDYRNKERNKHNIKNPEVIFKQLDESGISLSRQLKELKKDFKVTYYSDHFQTQTII